MPFNGSGTFQRIRNWVADAAAGIKIRADYHDSEDDGFAAGLSNCITKDGQTTPTANIPLGSRKIINLADPTVAQDAATKNYVDTYAAANPGFVKRTAIGTSTTTFQFDPTTTWAEVEVSGAGGGGGNVTASPGAGAGAAGSGGGSGGYAKKAFPITAAIRTATKTITIGAAGTGGSVPANGGNTSYGDTVNTLTGNGGFRGATGIASTAVVANSGGVGGNATGGDINIAGDQGGYSQVNVATGPSVRAITGRGATSKFGSGGNELMVTTGTNVQSNGNAGDSGAGGGGGYSIVAGGPALGGAGGAGYVVITEYR